MNFRVVPILVWLLCWIAVTATYLLAVSGGFVDTCIPHLTGCTSISRAGRNGLAFYVFKLLMMPAAVFIMVYWVLSFEWLKAIDPVHIRSARVTLVLGLLGAVFLILYVTFLGAEGALYDFYRLMRRYGTIVFFLGTFGAQLLLAIRCLQIFGREPVVYAKLVLCAIVIIELVVVLIVKQFSDDHDWLENSAEWRAASIVTFIPVLTWILWRRSDFRQRFEAKREVTKTASE